MNINGRLATRRANFSALIETLRHCKMNVRDIALQLCYSESGARKYARPMIDAEVVTVEIGHNAPDCPLAHFYVLTDDEAKISAFLASLETVGTNPRIERPVRRPAPHVIAKMNGPVRRDRFVAYLFGEAK